MALHGRKHCHVTFFCGILACVNDRSHTKRNQNMNQARRVLLWNRHDAALELSYLSLATYTNIGVIVSMITKRWTDRQLLLGFAILICHYSIATSHTSCGGRCRRLGAVEVAASCWVWSKRGFIPPGWEPPTLCSKPSNHIACIRCV